MQIFQEKYENPENFFKDENVGIGHEGPGGGEYINNIFLLAKVSADKEGSLLT